MDHFPQGRTGVGVVVLRRASWASAQRFWRRNYEDEITRGDDDELALNNGKKSGHESCSGALACKSHFGRGHN